MRGYTLAKEVHAGIHYTATKFSMDVGLEEMLTIPNNHVVSNMPLRVALNFAQGLLKRTTDDYPNHKRDNTYLVEVVDSSGKVYNLLFGETLYNSIDQNNAVGLIFDDVIPEINLDLPVYQLTRAVEILARSIKPNVALLNVQCTDFLEENPSLTHVVQASSALMNLKYDSEDGCDLQKYIASIPNKKHRSNVRKSLQECSALNIKPYTGLESTNNFWYTLEDFILASFGPNGSGLENDYSYDVAQYQWWTVKQHMLSSSEDSLVSTQLPLFVATYDSIEDDTLVGALAFIERADGTYSFHSFVRDSENAPDGLGRALLVNAAVQLCNSLKRDVTIDLGSAVTPWENVEDHYGIYKRNCGNAKINKLSFLASRLSSPKPYYNSAKTKWVTE